MTCLKNIAVGMELLCRLHGNHNNRKQFVQYLFSMPESLSLFCNFSFKPVLFFPKAILYTRFIYTILALFIILSISVRDNRDVPKIEVTCFQES